MSRRSLLRGVGGYLPAQVLTNDALAQRVDTTDEWIIERTGIRQRHIAAEGEFTSHLATAAARAALDHAGLAPDAVDLIIVATATPDETFPATATKVQHQLGISHGAAFDVQAVCSGFVYALAVADGMLRTGQADSALVIGAETFSRILDWNDRATCVLFGDGAGAVVLQASDRPEDAERGILASRLRADGRFHDHLYVDGGPSSTRGTGFVRMQGREVFRHAVENLASIMSEVLAMANWTADMVDWVVPHQANRRILDATARKLAIDPARVIVTVDRHANTSAASIPLALAAGVADGRVKPGDSLLLEAMGGGFTWGAVALRY